MLKFHDRGFSANDGKDNTFLSLGYSHRHPIGLLPAGASCRIGIAVVRATKLFGTYIGRHCCRYDVDRRHGFTRDHDGYWRFGAGDDIYEHPVLWHHVPRILLAFAELAGNRIWSKYRHDKKQIFQACRFQSGFCMVSGMVHIVPYFDSGHVRHLFQLVGPVYVPGLLAW